MSSLILLVEDDPGFTIVLRRLRENVDGAFCGTAELQIVGTLEQAKHVVMTRDVSLVILDLTLPDSRQIDTICFIEEHRHIWPPIIAVTGDERIEVRRDCLFAGASGFVLKQHIVESPNFFFATVLNSYLKHIRNRHEG